MTGAFIALGPNPSGTVLNWGSIRRDNTSLIAALQVTSNTSNSVGRVAAMRFIIPAGVTAANLRQASLQLCGFDNVTTRDDPYFTIAGEKVANAQSFTAASNPNGRFTANATTARWDIALDNLPPAPQMFIVPPSATYAVLDIVREIMNVPGWGAAGTSRSVVFFLKGRSDINKDGWLWNPPASGTDSYGPRLSITYGDVSSDAVDFDLGFIGNSHPAYAGHAGLPVNGIPVPIYGSATVNGCAGMKQVNSVLGWYGGDNFRGWTPEGFVQQGIETKWGADVEVYRAQHALGGSTCGQWYTQLADLTAGLWGDPTKSNSLRYRLAHPLSPSKRQLWVAEFFGNDVHAFGTSNIIYDPNDPGWVDDLWADFIETYDPRIRAILDEIFNRAYDPDLCWVYSPGLPNFALIGPGSLSPLRTLPNVSSGDIFRATYCLEAGSGGGAAGRQWKWDTTEQSTGHYGGRDYEQSAAVQANIAWQRANFPASQPPSPSYNPSAPTWDNAWLNINFPTLGPASYQTWAYGGVDRWQQGMRHVTDINVNRRMHQMLDTLWSRMAEEYPNVIYRPSWHLLGVDTVYSADPTSEYAQSSVTKWVEGIHPNMVGLADQYNAPGAQIDQMARYVPFLQRFAQMFTQWTGTAEVPIYLQGVWDGTTVQPCHFEGLVEVDVPPDLYRPVLLHTDDELDALALAIVDPTSVQGLQWNKAVGGSKFSASYVGTPNAIIDTSAKAAAAINDSQAAYCLALRYRLTGHEGSALASLACIEAYVSTTTFINSNYDGADGKLTASWIIPNFANAMALVWNHSTVDEPRRDGWRNWLVDVGLDGNTTQTQRSGAIYKAGVQVRGTGSGQPLMGASSQVGGSLLDHTSGSNWLTGFDYAKACIGVIVGGADGAAILSNVRDRFKNDVKSSVFYAGDSHPALGVGYPWPPTQQGDPTSGGYSGYDTAPEMATLWRFQNAAAAHYFSGNTQELGRDMSHAEMCLAPLVMFCIVMENNGTGDYTDDTVSGVTNMLARLVAVANVWSGYEREALLKAWADHGGSFTTLEGTTWTPAGTYVTVGSWATNMLGSNSGTPNWTHAGASADFGSFYLDEYLNRRKGQSIASATWLTERCRVTHATAGRSDTNMAGSGGNPQYANQQVLPALTFSPI